MCPQLKLNTFTKITIVSEGLQRENEFSSYFSYIERDN